MQRAIPAILSGLATLVSWTVATPVSAQAVLNEIRATGELRVGIQQDAIPFGYRDSQRNLQGYCLAFVQLLREQLREQLNLSILPVVEIVPTTVTNRFELVRDGRIQLECGPNTIRTDLEGVAFSQPFFLTGIRLLVPRENRNRLNQRNPENPIRIGVVANTTTAELIAERYPNAEIRVFRGNTATANGVSALQGTLDAYADDEILILGEMVKLQLSFTEYALVPNDPLECVFYGTILPDNDPEWAALVNDTITSAQEGALLQDWFGDVTEYVLPTVEYCTERFIEEIEERADNEET